MWPGTPSTYESSRPAYRRTAASEWLCQHRLASRIKPCCPAGVADLSDYNYRNPGPLARVRCCRGASTETHTSPQKPMLCACKCQSSCVIANPACGATRLQLQLQTGTAMSAGQSFACREPHECRPKCNGRQQDRGLDRPDSSPRHDAVALIGANFALKPDLAGTCVGSLAHCRSPRWRPNAMHYSRSITCQLCQWHW